MLLTAVDVPIFQAAADVLPGESDLDGVDHGLRNDPYAFRGDFIGCSYCLMG